MKIVFAEWFRFVEKSTAYLPVGFPFLLLGIKLGSKATHKYFTLSVETFHFIDYLCDEGFALAHRGLFCSLIHHKYLAPYVFKQLFFTEPLTQNMLQSKILLVLMLLASFLVKAQDTEQWRQKGYDAKENGDYDTAIDYYAKTLKVQPGDYDARLALARLYLKTEDYKKAENLFSKIYHNNHTDVEALSGLGDVYLMTDKLDKSVAMFQKAIALLPDNVPLYLKLAKAYSWQGKLQKAIDTYNLTLKIDDTYSEAYQGIGKMYYWKEKPYAALTYYKKALALNPEELPLRKEYEEIKKSLNYELIGKISFVNEKEQNYNIDALIQRYGVSKRLSNNINVSAGVLLDYSNRNFANTNVGDTVRLYDNTFAKISYLTQHHKVDVYAGYTVADSKLSSYGMAWRSTYTLGSFDMSNTLQGGYDYFYYWNNVGQNEAQDELQVKYKKFKLSVNYLYGIVDKKPILDVPNDRYEEDVNPHTGYGTGLTYQLLDLPKTNVGVSYSYLNYAYKSQYYYSPKGRHLYGPAVSVYYPFADFYVYADASYNVGSEYYYENINNELKTIYIDVSHWSANVEAGYQYNNWDFSLGSGKFYNPFYENFTAYLSIKYSL